MTAKLEGKELVVRIPVELPLQPSSTGKTLIVASSRGNQKTGTTIEGKEIVIGLNAYVYANGR